MNLLNLLNLLNLFSGTGGTYLKKLNLLKEFLYNGYFMKPFDNQDAF